MTQHELDTIIQSGEGYKTEFKRNVNSDLAKEIVAFANSSGGIILIGVEDDGTIAGITVDNSLRSKVQMAARDCDPSINVSMRTFKNVLIVDVHEGKDKPYRCTNGFYIRNGASSIKLSTQEIISFIKTEGKVKFDELRVPEVSFPKGLDEYAIKRFMGFLNLSSPVSPNELLGNLGAVYLDEKPPVVNNAGVLFFAKNPSRYIPHSVVNCIVYKGNGKVDILDKKSFDFDIITNIDETLKFIKRHLNVSFEIKSSRRKEKLEIPEVVLREAVVNAVAHRDYFEKGATVMVEIFDNRVEISNPGGLPKGLTAANFGTRTLARNSLIAALLNRAGYIEKLGTGIQRIVSEMKNVDLPEPEFDFNSFFTITLRRYNYQKSIKDVFKLTDKRAERIAFILKELANGTLNVEQAASNLATSSRTIRNDLDFLVTQKWVAASGTTKGRDYELTNKGKQNLSKYL